MKYIGKLYAKVGGKYIPMDYNSSQWDALEEKIKELEFEAMERRADLQDLETENKNLTQSRNSWEEMHQTAMSEWRKCTDHILKYNWISVNDRKKEIKGGWYLVCDPNSLPNQCIYALAFYSNYNGIWHEENGDQIHPTHYMKLPEAPKK